MIKTLQRLLFVAAVLASAMANSAVPLTNWWYTNFDHRYSIPVAAGATTLPTNYAVKVTFNHAAAVAAGQSVASGDDVRIVYWNGAAWIELDRVLDPDSSWNSATTVIWFRTQAAIAANATNDNYYLYHGDTAVPGTPPADPEVVWTLFDDFESGFDTARWNRSNNTNVTVAGGVLTINGSRQLRSTATFGLNTIFEVSSAVSTASPANFQYYLAGDNDCSDYTFDGYIRFRADNSAVDTLQNSAGTIAAPTTFTPTSPTTFQQYSFTREAAGAGRFFHNGAQITTFTGANTAAMCMFMRNESGTTSQTQRYDWARVRPYRYPDPSPALSALEDLPMPTTVGDWRMDQTTWTGAAGEVIDSSANGLNMRSYNGPVTANATPAIAGDPGTCRYGNFDGVDDYLEIADNSALDLPNQLTVTAWVYPRSYPGAGLLKSIWSKDENYEMHLNSSGQVDWWWGGGTLELVTAVAVPLNQWTHITVTYQSGMQRIYVNGVMRASGTVTGTLTTNADPFQIGQDQAFANRYWNGLIDEVRIYGQALSMAQVNTVMNETHPCSNAHHYLIAHDGYGITCAAVENVTVTVHDSLHNPVSAYTGAMTLDTQTGRGTWTLVSGSGTFADATANDGLATYTWPGGQSSATFALDYRSATPPATTPPGVLAVDIDAYETAAPTIRDDDTEGFLNFAPSGFTVTSAALGNPPPISIPAFASPQIAGTNFPMHITAYGQTPTDTTCGVIEGYTGNKNIKFWTTYANPNTGTIQATINATAIQTTEAASAAQSVTFTNGTANVTAKYKDVGQLSISLKDDTTGNPGLPTGIRGGTGNFISKPDNILITAITRQNGTVNAGPVVDQNSTVFLAAGRPFRTTVTVRDAENSATPNFGKETPAESVGLVPVLVSPAGGNNPPVVQSGTHVYNNGVANNGVANNVDFTWPEVGIIDVSPHIQDGNYMTAGDVSGNTISSVGRFIPERFDMSANVPQFQTQCGTFTYLGQPFRYVTAPVVTATAKAFTGETTQNYVGVYNKLSAAAVTRTYQPAASLDATNIPAGDVTVTKLTGLNAGLTTVGFTLGSTAGQGLAYLRGNTPVAPMTPPPAITIDVALLDTDSVASNPNPFVVGGAGISFNNGSEQRYGRVSFRNAIGSELINLPLTMRAEYFLSASAGFVRNMGDSCTTATVPAPPPAAYGGNLNQNETCLLDSGQPGNSGFGCPVAAPLAQRFNATAVGGDFNATLQAPSVLGGPVNNGTVTVTAIVPVWMRFNWDATTPTDENPSAIATFGIFQGESRRIFQIEK